MDQVATNKACQKCGGEITTEQIVNKQAGLVQGVLLCPTCVEEKRQELLAAAQRAAQAAAAKPVVDILDQKIALVDDFEPTKAKDAPRIRSFSEGSTLAGAHHDATLKRPLGTHDEPATRCRSFHSKLNPAALAHMDDLINEFLDNNPDVFVKFATTTVGVFEAKHPEPHLILTIFY